MNQPQLQEALDLGLSVEAIARDAGRHPSTVSYWLKRHRLEPNGRRHRPKEGLDRDHLDRLANEELTLKEMAAELGVSQSNVRFWLVKYGLENGSARRRKRIRRALDAGQRRLKARCNAHGPQEFFRQGRSYRCPRCRSEAVSRRRRMVKLELIEEAGGKCAICG